MNRYPRSTTPCRPPPSGGRPMAHSTFEAGATATVAPCRPRLSRPQVAQVKSSIPKRGPPPAPPKKVDYKRPQMTRAMEQRLKHTQRLQEQLERRERERSVGPCPPAARRPKRCAPPSGSCGQQRRRSPEDRGSRCPSGNRAESARPAQPASRCPSKRSQQAVPERTLNLAKDMNADIVQAEPMEDGPIDNLIIPPGAINSEKTTVISIPQPAERLPSSSCLPGAQGSSQQQANRSIQVISESLDEQEAVEAAMINSKLQDLQQARRDFVMAVANVGGNALNIQDEETMANVSRISNVTPPPMMGTPEPSSPRLIPCPDLDDPCLRPEYGRNHPVVEAAREYLRTRQTERYIDEDFSRGSCPRVNRDERYEREEYLETIADEDELSGQCTAIPRREPYHYLPMPVERLERFFDVQNYPPPAHHSSHHSSGRPPPGRECLPQDLWELEDPWYQEEEQPDLIDWADCR